MSNLADLQSNFVHAIFNKADEQAIIEQIVSHDNRDAQQSLAIYRGAILSSFCRALSLTFPVIEKLLGEKFFEAMANKYAQITPSLQPDLGELGKDFSQFIANFAPVAHLSYLSDVAELEYSWEMVFYADNDPENNFATLADLDENQLQQVKFVLSKSTYFIQSDYPILSIWQANQSDADVIEIDQNSGSQQLLLLRQNDICRMDIINDQDWQLLMAMKQGETFAELIARFGIETINQLLPVYVEHGWLVAVE